MKALHYGRQTVDQRDIDAVTKVLQGDWLTQGPSIPAFEEALCQLTGAKYAIAVANGTAALHLAALALDLQGASGWTSAITFVASANCIRYAGAETGFVDVDPETGLMDLDDLRKRLQRAKTPPKVIIPVDLAGQPAHLPEIQALAGEFGAKVIEDAAHSLGAHYQEGSKKIAAGACQHTDLAILSFHPIKHITTGEGGAVLTNNPEYAAHIRKLRSHGIHKSPDAFTLAADSPYFGPWYHEQDQLGFNYRITDFQCALGSTQLARLGEFVRRRQSIAQRYNKALETKAELAQTLCPLKTAKENENAHHLYVIRVRPKAGESLESLALRRRDLYKHLRHHQIFAQVNYIPVPWQPYYQRRGIDADDFPGAKEYYASCLSLPIYPLLTDDDVDRVVETLCSWAKK